MVTELSEGTQHDRGSSTLPSLDQDFIQIFALGIPQLFHQPPYP